MRASAAVFSTPHQSVETVALALAHTTHTLTLSYHLVLRFLELYVHPSIYGLARELAYSSGLEAVTKLVHVFGDGLVAILLVLVGGSEAVRG